MKQKICDTISDKFFLWNFEKDWNIFPKMLLKQQISIVNSCRSFIYFFNMKNNAHCDRQRFFIHINLFKQILGYFLLVTFLVYWTFNGICSLDIIAHNDQGCSWFVPVHLYSTVELKQIALTIQPGKHLNNEKYMERHSNLVTTGKKIVNSIIDCISQFHRFDEI